MNQNKRFKIALETSTSCIGKCPGCALTSEQRLSQRPAVTDISNYVKKISSFYNNLKTKIKGHEVLVIELVVGEHFNFDKHYLESLYEELSIFLNSTNKKFIVAISTSGLLPLDKLKIKFEELSKYFKREQLEIHLVCNLNMIEKYEQKYREVLELCQIYFGLINILTNFDNQLKLENATVFSKIIKDFKITDFQLVYGLKQHNIKNVNFRTDLFYNIFEDIIRYNQSGFRQNDIKNELTRFITKENEENIVLEIKKGVDKWKEEQLYIDHNGNIYNFISTMIGGIELEERAGITPITNIYEKDCEELYIRDKKSTVVKLIKTYSNHNMCQYCNIKEECYSSGIPLMIDFFENNGKCENPILPFYKNSKTIIESVKYSDIEDWKEKLN